MADEPRSDAGVPGAAEAWDGAERRVARRRTKRRYRFIDRRHGFDRRRRYPVLGTMRDHSWIVVAVIVLLNLLSLIDGYFTAAELGLGLATEGNPVLAAASNQHPWFAVAVKLGAMVVVSVSIWHGRRRRSILAIAIVALAVFAGVVAYHAGHLSALGYL